MYELINRTSKQNRTRKIEIKNNLTVNRGKGGKMNNRGKKGKGHQGTCIKDTWTKPKWGRIKGGRWGSLGRGKCWWENGENCT